MFSLRDPLRSMKPMNADLQDPGSGRLVDRRIAQRQRPLVFFPGVDLHGGPRIGARRLSRRAGPADLGCPQRPDGSATARAKNARAKRPTNAVAVRFQACTKLRPTAAEPQPRRSGKERPSRAAPRPCRNREGRGTEPPPTMAPRLARVCRSIGAFETEGDRKIPQQAGHLNDPLVHQGDLFPAGSERARFGFAAGALLFAFRRVPNLYGGAGSSTGARRQEAGTEFSPQASWAIRPCLRST